MWDLGKKPEKVTKTKLERIKEAVETGFDNTPIKDTRGIISYLVLRLESAEQALVIAGRSNDRMKAGAAVEEYFNAVKKNG